LSLSVALVDLPDDFFRILVAARQDPSQEDLDVPGAQQRQRVALKLPFPQEEHHAREIPIGRFVYPASTLHNQGRT
jgi:hypothetical protein